MKMVVDKVTARSAAVWLVLVLFGVWYCAPGHPSAGAQLPLDVVFHAGLFLFVGVFVGVLTGGQARNLFLVAVVAFVLEVAQWWLGGYSVIEWTDVVANEAGVSLAALVLLARHFVLSVWM